MDCEHALESVLEERKYVAEQLAARWLTFVFTAIGCVINVEDDAHRKIDAEIESVITPGNRDLESCATRSAYNPPRSSRPCCPSQTTSRPSTFSGDSQAKPVHAVCYPGRTDMDLASWSMLSPARHSFFSSTFTLIVSLNSAHLHTRLLLSSYSTRAATTRTTQEVMDPLTEMTESTDTWDEVLTITEPGNRAQVLNEMRQALEKTLSDNKTNHEQVERMGNNPQDPRVNIGEDTKRKGAFVVQYSTPKDNQDEGSFSSCSPENRCSLPRPRLPSLLSESWVSSSTGQRHVCTEDYCKRKRRLPNGRLSREKVCRFYFPRQIHETGQLTHNLNLKHLTYEPARNDQWINNFSRVISLGWLANIDITPCTSAFAVINYISKYCSKGEVQSKTYKKLAATGLAFESKACRCKTNPAVTEYLR